jgi:hypothetical protein
VKHTLEIGSLRLYTQSGAPDALASRRAVERLLAIADLHPPGLPPSAVLVVRKLSDPLPGKLAKSPGAAQFNQAWERQARRQLAECCRHAARPALGAVPARAGAVLFLDESELLACLLRDLLQGAVFRRWWWQGVLRNGFGGRALSAQEEVVEAVVRSLERKAHLVPAVLSRLDDWSLAEETGRLLSEEQARRIFGAVLWAYDLQPGPQAGEAMATQFPPLPPVVFSPPRWAALGRDRAALIGLCLDLYDRPRSVRSASYLGKLSSWLQVDRRPPLVHRLPARGNSPPEAQAARLPEQPGEAEDWLGSSFGSALAERSQALPRSPTAQPSAAAGQAGQLQTAHTDQPANASARPPRTPHLVPAEGPPGPGKFAGQQSVGDPADDQAAAAGELNLPAEPGGWMTGGLTTRLGGILYLINLLTFLDLPDCFETGWRLSSMVGPWGLVEALARALPGERFSKLEDDPLWTALAQLDGRQPGERPGYRMPRSRPRRWPAFALPERWLQDLPDEAARLSRPPRRKIHGYRTASPWLDRWLALALPFITHRLCLALRLPEEETLLEALLLVPGHLYLSSSHIDLVAPVEAISLPVRLAGLDRDPGWLPEFGRVVYFHFIT